MKFNCEKVDSKILFKIYKSIKCKKQKQKIDHITFSMPYSKG